MYHWRKNIVRDTVEAPDVLQYKGLSFPLYLGRLTSEQFSLKQPHYAWFGGKAMTAAQIRYNVNLMISRGIVAA
jgi:hypothetical protein